MNPLEELLSESELPKIKDKVLIGGNIGRVISIEKGLINVELIFSKPTGEAEKEIHTLKTSQIKSYVKSLKCWQSDVDVLKAKK